MGVRQMPLQHPHTFAKQHQQRKGIEITPSHLLHIEITNNQIIKQKHRLGKYLKPDGKSIN